MNLFGKFKSGQRLILIATVMSVFLGGFSARADKEQNSGSPWTKSWKGLKASKQLGLIEGTYKGVGKNKRQTFLMHVRRYFSNSKRFLVIIENISRRSASIGFFEARNRGQYDWYPLSFEPEFHPTSDSGYRFALEYNGDGSLKRILGFQRDENGLESLEFSSARQLIWEDSLPLGTWTGKINPVRNLISENVGRVQVTLNPDFNEEASDYDAATANEVSRYSVDFVETVEKSGDVQTNIVADRIFPGIFEMKSQEIQNYVPEIGAPSFIAVSIGKFSFPKRYWFDDDYSAKVYLFKVGSSDSKLQVAEELPVTLSYKKRD